ncbi:hypothetical protein G3R49_19700 [Shewanella sp. WXL01]|uniref:hypothetical protein n=1 Tax=Shewanella sp. WXL01 TaxID=2709721 RepID=UPI0014386283|nr:hypothetical protein [Shewanella sp. WXL01]NKF52785.1 hypothetical protein [Shewanella sp. WXL01]
MEDLPINEQSHGDDLTGVEQGHFDEFDQAMMQAREQEGSLEPESVYANPEHAPAAPHVSGAEIIAPVVQLGCALLAPNWDIQPEEQQALADSYGALIDKYFPDGAGSFGVELNALLITGAIVTPRLGKPRRIEKDIDTTREAANDDTPSQTAS